MLSMLPVADEIEREFHYAHHKQPPAMFRNRRDAGKVHVVQRCNGLRQQENPFSDGKNPRKACASRMGQPSYSHVMVLGVADFQ